MAEMVDKMSADEFERYALDIVARELGVYGSAPFHRTYRKGSADYTRARHERLDGLTVEEAIGKIKAG